MLTITKRFRFEAAHHLPQHQGKCVEVHGHSYELEVTLRGEVNLVSGMLIDFGELKNVVERKVIMYLDHKDLNLVLDNPTAENLLLWIRRQLSGDWLPDGVMLSSLKLNETRDCWAGLLIRTGETNAI